LLLLLLLLRQAKEFGEAEVWMNERMTRTSPASCAEFLGGFLDTPEPGQKVGPAGEHMSCSVSVTMQAVNGDLVVCHAPATQSHLLHAPAGDIRQGLLHKASSCHMACVLMVFLGGFLYTPELGQKVGPAGEQL
jgi:hypothetical protein